MPDEITNQDPQNPEPPTLATPVDVDPTINPINTEVSKKKRHLPVVAIALLLTLAIAVAGFVIYKRSSQPPALASEIHSFFEYDQSDLEKLKQQKPIGEMTVPEALVWQEKAYSLIEEHGTGDVDASKIYAYLSVAQLDAAVLTYKSHGTFGGSLSNVSKEVLCQFYEDSCSSLKVNEDAFSKQLTETIMAKIKQRIEDDNKNTKEYTLVSGDQYWQGPAPQIGLSAGTFKPWLTESNDQFRPTTPPPEIGSTEQQEQLAIVKRELGAATNEQKTVVVKWAGGPGTKTPPGIWLTLADDYMRQKELPLQQYLQIRAVTSLAMADAVGAVFDGKYTFQSKRPNMIDTSINTIMPTPNHPSYPAGHSTISWAAASVLQHYLPENSEEWERLAVEAGYSRVIGGIHFPLDDEVGTTLGKNVGNEAVKNW